MAAVEPPNSIQLSPSGPSSSTNGVSLPPVDGSVTPFQSFDTSVMRTYLMSLLPPMLGALPEEVQECVDDSEFDERVQRFASEGGGPLYVVKVRDEVEGAYT